MQEGRSGNKPVGRVSVEVGQSGSHYAYLVRSWYLDYTLVNESLAPHLYRLHELNAFTLV